MPGAAPDVFVFFENDEIGYAASGATTSMDEILPGYVIVDREAVSQVK
jgi:hypothetical protein